MKYIFEKLTRDGVVVYRLVSEHDQEVRETTNPEVLLHIMRHEVLYGETGNHCVSCFLAIPAEGTVCGECLAELTFEEIAALAQKRAEAVAKEAVA